MYQVIARIGTVGLVALVAGVAEFTRQHPVTPPVAAQDAPGAPIAAGVGYRYDAPPSISREAYSAIVCAAGPACDDAGAMYDVLVEAGIDPVVEAAQAMHETGLGKDGIGREPYKNLHGVQCHASDGRIGDSKVKWGNGCAGVYASYTASVQTWANVINREYVALGLNTPALAVSKYAPVSDGNDPPAYVADMERHIDQWRAEYQPSAPADDTRARLVETALSQMGKSYILGAQGPDHFDCSGLMMWTYAQYGIDISRTTFTQLEAPQLRAIDVTEVQTADLIYFQFPSDQHVGMLADLDGDGTWDMVQSGGTRSDVNIAYDVLNDPVYNNNIIGFRSAL